jgi:hypothetical protein
VICVLWTQREALYQQKTESRYKKPQHEIGIVTHNHCVDVVLVESFVRMGAVGGSSTTGPSMSTWQCGTALANTHHTHPPTHPAPKHQRHQSTRRRRRYARAKPNMHMHKCTCIRQTNNTPCRIRF